MLYREIIAVCFQIHTKYINTLCGQNEELRLATGWTVRGSNPGGGRDFLHLSRPALGSTHPPLQWVLGLSRGVKSGRGMTLTPHPLLVLLVMKE